MTDLERAVAEALGDVVYRAITDACRDRPDHGLVGEHGTHNLLTRYVVNAVTPRVAAAIEAACGENWHHDEWKQHRRTAGLAALRGAPDA